MFRPNTTSSHITSPLLDKASEEKSQLDFFDEAKMASKKILESIQLLNSLIHRNEPTIPISSTLIENIETYLEALPHCYRNNVVNNSECFYFTLMRNELTTLSKKLTERYQLKTIENYISQIRQQTNEFLYDTSRESKAEHIRALRSKNSSC